LKRRLLAVNLILAALIAALGAHLRGTWLEQRAREQQVRSQPLRVLPAPPITPANAPAPLQAAQYIEIAQKMLFSKDRNPNVEEVVAPPKPMPPLPVAHGVFLFGDAPTVILSEKAGAPHKAYRPGQTVGEFKLVAVNNKEIEFEWEGKSIKRSLQELLEEGAKQGAPSASTQAEAPAAAPRPAATSSSALSGAKSGPGVDIGASVRACAPGDASPAGTVQDGMRKVITDSPFGKVCRWEPVK
jgi:hypothetical protein